MSNLDTVPRPSSDVVARVMEGEIIIVPLATGIGDMEDELYTLNDTGKAVWDRLDGRRTLGQVVKDLAVEFDAPESVLQTDVLGLVDELLKRKILIAD